MQRYMNDFRLLVPAEGLYPKRRTKSFMYFCTAATNQLGFFGTISPPVLRSSFDFIHNRTYLIIVDV